MPIPTYDALMLPVLRHSAEKTWAMRDMIRAISNELGLSEPERAELIPSGNTPLVANRIHWAKTHLKKAGLVEQPKHGHVQITDRGRTVLAGNPSKIDSVLLKQFPEFATFCKERSPQWATERVRPDGLLRSSVEYARGTDRIGREDFR